MGRESSITRAEDGVTGCVLCGAFSDWKSGAIELLLESWATVVGLAEVGDEFVNASCLR